MDKNILSIDIGTSSVKISIVTIHNNSYEIKSQSKCYYDTQRIRANNLPPNYSQQNVQIIFEAIDNALKSIKFDGQIDSITVCGQMHSCVLWNHRLFDEPFDPQNLRFDMISDNYDWTDGRCNEEFLKTLPKPDSFADKVSSGFGCATLFWLKRFKPDYLNQFDRCGTIMDWFVCLLCRLNIVSISIHNAHAWAYLDPIKPGWNLDILKQAEFPVHLLPKPVESNVIVGQTQFQWHSIIKPGIPVYVAIGDLQAMMFLAFKDNPDAIVLNMSTAAQICRLLVDKDRTLKIPRKSQLSIQSYDYYPFKNNEYLLVAPSLNGGNVLQSFMGFIQSTVKCLTNNDLTRAEIWEKLFHQFPTEFSNNDQSDEENFISIKPTLFGERHDLNSVFTVNISGGKQPSLFNIINCLCFELIQNVFNMMPNVSETIQNNFKQKIQTKLICTGSVIANNPILQRSLLLVIRRILYENNENKNNNDMLLLSNLLQSSLIDIEYVDKCDADVGCALFIVSESK
ncbi:sedoheptulokinase-like [Dermatophagoides pteronyssinus]|uniref:sedoheptulokinase-like n=1 Tax=Dermatophagoides pteronyssinus TaxID=6956 RepID=UPI003F674ADE